MHCAAVHLRLAAHKISLSKRKCKRLMCIRLAHEKYRHSLIRRPKDSDMELAKTFTISVSMHANANNFARSGISNSSLLIKKRGTTKTTQCSCNGKALANVADGAFAKYSCRVNGCQTVAETQQDSLVPSAL